MWKTVEALVGRPADSGSGAGCANVGTLGAAELAGWACSPANDNPAKTINKTVIFISRTDLTIVSSEHCIRLSFNICIRRNEGEVASRGGSSQAFFWKTSQSTNLFGNINHGRTHALERVRGS
jgi:hypothetical protein